MFPHHPFKGNNFQHPTHVERLLVITSLLKIKAKELKTGLMQNVA